MDAQHAPKYISLYSGVGGLDMGLAIAGMTPVATCEPDETAHITHRGWMAQAKKLFGHLSDAAPDHYDDVEELIDDLDSGAADYAGTDVVIGGPPCQGFSAGGNLDPNDPRSVHVHKFLDVVDAVRPRYFVMENVAVLATARRWKQVRSGLVSRAKKLGYATSLHLVDAADYGVAQHRERMILIGSRDGDPVAEPSKTHADNDERITVAEALRRLPSFGDKGNDTYYGCRVTLSAKPVVERARTPYQGIFFNGPGRPLDFDRPSRTLTASMEGGRGPVIDEEAVQTGSKPWLDLLRTPQAWRRALRLQSGPRKCTPPHGRGGQGAVLLSAADDIGRKAHSAVPPDRQRRAATDVSSYCPIPHQGHGT